MTGESPLPSSTVGPSVTDSGPSGGLIGSKTAPVLPSCRFLLLVVTIAFVVQVNYVDETKFLITHSSLRVVPSELAPR